MTYGDKYAPAMLLKTKKAAQQYLEMCVEHHMRLSNHTKEEAEKIEKANLGYWAGYYSHSTRERVERLFECAHPIFGSIKENGPPTPTEAFLAGLTLGNKANNKARNSDTED